MAEGLRSQGDSRKHTIPGRGRHVDLGMPFTSEEIRKFQRSGIVYRDLHVIVSQSGIRNPESVAVVARR
jgi:hypothetical protein